MSNKGKEQPSGAQNRKVAKAKETENERCARVREEAGWDSDKYFKVDPPPNDAIGRIAWAGQLNACALHAIIEDPAMRFETKLKHIADFTRSLGLTHAKALMEERLLGLESKAGIAKGQHDDDGLEPDPEGA